MISDRAVLYRNYLRGLYDETNLTVAAPPPKGYRSDAGVELHGGREAALARRRSRRRSKGKSDGEDPLVTFVACAYSIEAEVDENDGDGSPELARVRRRSRTATSL